MRININQEGLTDAINKSFRPLVYDKKRFVVLRGGTGSGKSHFAAQKIILRVLAGIKKGIKHNMLVLRRFSPSCRTSVFPLLTEYVNQWGLSPFVKINKTDMTFNFKDGSLIRCQGLDDESKIKSIHNVTSIWLEEANEMTYDMFMILNQRLRGPTQSYYQMIMSFNPVDTNTWLYSIFFDEKEQESFHLYRKNATLHHSTYKDNSFLDEFECKIYEDYINQDIRYYNVYTLGEWGILGGLIFKNWKVVPEFKDCKQEVYGLDFAYKSPTALVKVGRNGSSFFMEEKLYRKEMTNQDLIGWMKQNIKTGVVYCDSAEPGRIEELQREKWGLTIKPARKGKNSVKDGLDFMKRYRMNITNISENLIKELQGYKYKEDKKSSTDTETVYLDEPVKIDDHAVDAARYAIYTHWGKPEVKLDIYWV